MADENQHFLMQLMKIKSNNKSVKTTTLVTQSGTLFKIPKHIMIRISVQSYCDLFFECYNSMGCSQIIEMLKIAPKQDFILFFDLNEKNAMD